MKGHSKNCNCSGCKMKPSAPKPVAPGNGYAHHFNLGKDMVTPENLTIHFTEGEPMPHLPPINESDAISMVLQIMRDLDYHGQVRVMQYVSHTLSVEEQERMNKRFPFGYSR